MSLVRAILSQSLLESGQSNKIISIPINKSIYSRSEPFLGIPRASLKSVRSSSHERSARASDVDLRKLHVSIDLNNNVSDQRGSGISRSNSERMTQNHRQENLLSSTKSSQQPLSVSRHLEMNVISNNLTREQIISLFSAGQEEPGPFSQSEARTGTGRANERARL